MLRTSFPTTHWTLLFQAGQPDGADALDTVIERYRQPLLAHLRFGRGLSPEDAEDVMHSFLLEKVLKRGLLAVASQERGRFRTFVLTALDRFLWNWQRARDGAQRRPEGGLVSLECEGLKPHGEGVIAESSAFDKAWVLHVLEESGRRMEEQCRLARREDMWRVFESRILLPAQTDAEPLDYGRLQLELGHTAVKETQDLLTTGKRMFRRVLREVVAEFAPDEAEAESLLQDLVAVLRGGGA